MSVEPRVGGAEVVDREAEEVEVRVVDLGDAVVETRQLGFWTQPDCVMAPYSKGCS